MKIKLLVVTIISLTTLLLLPQTAFAAFQTTVDGITFIGSGSFYNANLTQVTRSGTYSGAPLYKLMGHGDWDQASIAQSFFLHFKMQGVQGKQVALQYEGSKSTFQHLWYKYSNSDWQIFPTPNTVVSDAGSDTSRAISPTFTQNEVEISVFLPYGETEVLALNTLVAASAYGDVHVAGKSALGKDIYGYTITDPGYASSVKKVIVLTTGQHAYEMLGMRLTGEITKILLSNDANAVALRKKAVILIYPLINVDGVARGHNRNNVYEIDLNRSWLVNDTDQQAVDQTKAIETNVLRPDIISRSGGSAWAFIDFHNTQFYGATTQYAAYEHPRTPESIAFLNKVASYFGRPTNNSGQTAFWLAQWAEGTSIGYLAAGWGHTKLGAVVALTPEYEQFNDGDIKATSLAANAIVRTLAESVPGQAISTSSSSSSSSSGETEKQRADINQDHFIDLSDYSLLAANFFKSNYSPRADINRDGSVDLSDYGILTKYFLQGV
jgi:predicted deacylase